MKKLLTVSLILTVLLLSYSFSTVPIVRGEGEDQIFLLKSTVQYSNPSQNSEVWNFAQREEDRTISLFMNNNWQTVELVNSTFSVEREDYDEDGNSVAVLQFPSSVLSPGSNLSYTVWYRITAKPRTIPEIDESLSGNLSDMPQSLVLTYTREEGSWQISNPTLLQLAYNLSKTETNVLTIVKNFVAWIKEHVSYPQTRHENPYYPIETYTRREGDCDDQAMLLITLCRIVRIPAYLQIGCIYMPNYFDNDTFWDDHVFLTQKRIGWHGWAVVCVPPWGWLPVDLTYVPQGFDDPLNAIKHGAIASQSTIQYMNVTSSNYVALSVEFREFLVQNGFTVHSEDEMIENGSPSSNPSMTTFNPLTFAAPIVLAASVLLVFLALRYFGKKRAPTMLPPPEGL